MTTLLEGCQFDGSNGTKSQGCQASTVWEGQEKDAGVVVVLDLVLLRGLGQRDGGHERQRRAKGEIARSSEERGTVHVKENNFPKFESFQ